MLAVFPLTTARDRRWWSHWHSLGRQTHQQVSSQDHSKKGQWTCHTHQWSQLPLVVSGNCFGGHDNFGILQPQLLWLQNQPVWQSLYSGPEQKYVHTKNAVLFVFAKSSQ